MLKPSYLLSKILKDFVLKNPNRFHGGAYTAQIKKDENKVKKQFLKQVYIK